MSPNLPQGHSRVPDITLPSRPSRVGHGYVKRLHNSQKLVTSNATGARPARLTCRQQLNPNSQLLRSNSDWVAVKK